MTISIFISGHGDGNYEIYLLNSDGSRELYVMNADGSGQMRLTDNPANDGNAVWSP